MPHRKTSAPKKGTAKRRRAGGHSGVRTTRAAAKSKTARAPSARKTARAKKPSASTGAACDPTPDERAYAVATLVRGEAAAADPDGALPGGATHEIVGTGEAGVPEIRRRRFSAI